MDNAEIMRLIDSGANFYCRQLGNASHMEFKRLKHYSMIHPKPGERGGTSVFDVTLEDLADAEAALVIDEIKSLNEHTWWGLCLSDRIYRLVHGTPRPLLSREEHENAEEVYMALFPEDRRSSRGEDTESANGITRVRSSEEFAIWADLCNSVLHDNYPIIHRVNHYEICRTGLMPCYLAYLGGQPAGTAAILNDGEVASLEFVATLPQFKRQGVARSACERAVDEAFREKSKVITTRAFQTAKDIYRAIGFRIYY